MRLAKQRAEEVRKPSDLPAAERLHHYLGAVVRGEIKFSGLTSLENNLIVVEILQAARESVRTGKSHRRGAVAVQ